ncbi:MAG: hypothetical protein WD696_21185 [Bryobacteraceae bacterium]
MAQSRARKQAILTIGMFLLLAGCAYVGEPLPPLLHIPERVTDLTAVQRGSKIAIQFTLPELTTEGTLIKRFGEVDLRAGPASGETFDAERWAAGAKHLTIVEAERGRVRHEVPVLDWVGQEVMFGVRVAGESGRDIGWSNFAVLEVIEPLDRPRELSVENVAEGVRLTWTGTSAAYRIFRRGGGEQGFAAVASVKGREWIDGATEYGKLYSYYIQAVGGKEPNLAESELSLQVEITPVDRFAPAPPKGLTAIAGANGIELVWERSQEMDTAGYRVYRAEGEAAPTPLEGPLQVANFSDRNVRSGKRYRYAISAIDREGNESDPSTTIAVTAP